MARAALVAALALGAGALTPPPTPKTPVTGRQAVVKERKQLLPPTVAPLRRVRLGLLTRWERRKLFGVEVALEVWLEQSGAVQGRRRHAVWKMFCAD